MVKNGFRETQRMASSALGHSQCVPYSKQLHHSQNDCKYLHGRKNTILLVIAILAGIALSGIPVIIHVRIFKHSLPPPRIWQLGMPQNCFTWAILDMNDINSKGNS